ncbi:hypothetical protein INR49_005701 [Caranx melampygus]|nr:hypothetical protein INR49_005701 [Caranx melampygus]
MWDHEIRAMASTHAIIAASVFMATVLPAVFVPGFSVYGTHLLWLYSVSGTVTAVSVAVFWLLGITPPTKKHTLGYKLSRLYALETFSLSVLLTSLTTLRCLCVLGPNVQAWIRVFSRHGAMSVWDTCLQITVACTVVGAWVGAFPIPWTGTDRGR